MKPRAILALAGREVRRFLRQPSRIGGALGSPILFWFLIGWGFSGSFRLPAAASAGAAADDVSFQAWFYPGILALVVLFAAIFSSISVIEDRREGFLQGVLASPVSAFDLTAGKVLGSALLAWVQGLSLLVLAPLAGVTPPVAGWLGAAGLLALLALAMTSLGFLFAWRVDSVQGFHAVMNLVLIPLWLLSGAFFPAAGAPAWLARVMAVNPLTWAVDALRGSLGAGPVGLSPAPGTALTAGVAVLAFVAAVLTARRGRVP